MKNILKIAVAALVGASTSTAAEAACNLGDLRGTWFAEGIGGNVAGHCKLVFDANGALITGAKMSECTYDEPESFATVTLRASGRLLLSDSEACGFSGTITIGGRKVSTSNLRVRMSADKDSLAAAGPVISSTMVMEYGGDAAVAFAAVKKRP